jgi:dTDP-4-dehydrorhamnose 3,5-epimerase
MYKQSEFAALDIPPFVQTNHSRSVRGVLRGLHYQDPPYAQGKLVTVARGCVFDVGVDIRKGSPTYGRWVSAILSDGRCHDVTTETEMPLINGLLYIPPGFAHGFYVLSEVVDLVYQVTAEYSHPHDRGILWNDPDIGIAWPSETPRLSPKDAQQPRLHEVDNPFVYEQS